MANLQCKKPLDNAELARAKQLRGLGWSWRQIGREMQRSDKTIAKALTASPEVIQEVRDITEQIAVAYEQLSTKILKSIEPKIIEKAGLRDRVISAATCTDKSRLLRNQTTANVAIGLKAFIVEAWKEDDEEPTKISVSGQKAELTHAREVGVSSE